MQESNMWLQLARLNKRCTVRLRSFHTPEPAASMRWRMTIRPKESDDAGPIVVEADSAHNTIIQGLAAANTVSWGAEP